MGPLLANESHTSLYLSIRWAFLFSLISSCLFASTGILVLYTRQPTILLGRKEAQQMLTQRDMRADGRMPASLHFPYHTGLPR